MYAIVDVETTGGQNGNDRITEIAIFLHDGEKIVDKFVTLVNPQRRIDPFVVRLTHITDKMVEKAPTFEQIQQDVWHFFEGNIFVAHNSRFDFGMIRAEFRRLGIAFKAKQLCTVNLARKAVPGHTSYSLGTICKALEIPLENHHRAEADAFATVKLLEHILALDPNLDFLNAELNYGLNPKFVPEKISISTIQELTEEAGVIYFLDENKKLLFVESGKNIRKEVIQFFDKSHQDLNRKEWFQNIASMDIETTGSELMASLFAHNAIKKQKPLYNKQPKTLNYQYGIYLTKDEQGFAHLKVIKMTQGVGELKLKFTTKTAATKARDKIFIDSQIPVLQALIKKMTDTQKILEYQPIYNEKMESAADQYLYKYGSFLLMSDGIRPEEKSVVWVKDNEYKGFGYISMSEKITRENIELFIKNDTDEAEIQKIIRNAMRKDKRVKTIPI